MKEFLNEEKKPFSELTAEEMHCVVMAKMTGGCEVFFPNNWNKSGIDDSAAFSGIYRTKPAKKLVVPFELFKPEVICAAKDEDGSIYVFMSIPNKYNAGWRAASAWRIDMLLGVDGDGVDWENSLTFRDGAK